MAEFGTGPCCKTPSGIARVLRALVQRHVMGPLVTKQLRNSLAFCSYM